MQYYRNYVPTCQIGKNKTITFNTVFNTLISSVFEPWMDSSGHKQSGANVWITEYKNMINMHIYNIFTIWEEWN